MPTTKWTLDGTHSEIRFKIKHLMISNVSGNFNKFDAEVKTKSDDFITASITAKIDVASINTNNEQRDAHLRTADFLSQKTSTNHISSTSIERADEEMFNKIGELSIKDTTKPIKLLANTVVLPKIHGVIQKQVLPSMAK